PNTGSTTATASTPVSVAGSPLVNNLSCPSTGVTAGKAFSCTSTPSGDTSPYTFSWTLPAGCSGTSTTGTISVTCSPKGSYVINSTVTDFNSVRKSSLATVTVGGQAVTNSLSCAAATNSKPFTCTSTAG